MDFFDDYDDYSEGQMQVLSALGLAILTVVAIAAMFFVAMLPVLWVLYLIKTGIERKRSKKALRVEWWLQHYAEYGVSSAEEAMTPKAEEAFEKLHKKLWKAYKKENPPPKIILWGKGIVIASTCLSIGVLALFGADKSLAAKKVVSLDVNVNQALHEHSRKDYLSNQDYRLNYSVTDMLNAGVTVEPGSETSMEDYAEIPISIRLSNGNTEDMDGMLRIMDMKQGEAAKEMLSYLGEIRLFEDGTGQPDDRGYYYLQIMVQPDIANNQNKAGGIKETEAPSLKVSLEFADGPGYCQRQLSQY